tara:strand:- start:620 stop:838 length:219 start_codon:yes stop_codon:yes gene_type:complete
MRYTYKVFELGPEVTDPKTNEVHVEVMAPKQMEAMSFKKLRRKLDPDKKYHIEYRNKKDNYVSANVTGLRTD